MSFTAYDTFDNAHWLFLGYRARGFVQFFTTIGAGNFISEAVAITDHRTSTILLRPDQFDMSVAHVLDKMIHDEEWRTETSRRYYDVSEQYFGLCDRFHGQSFHHQDDAELSTAFQVLLTLQQETQLLGSVLHGLAPVGEQRLIETLKNEVRLAGGTNQHFDTTWSKLTLPTKLTFWHQKDLAIARLAEESRGKSKESVDEGIQTIDHKYSWLYYQCQGPGVPAPNFEADFQAATQSNTNLDLVEQMQRIAREQHELMDSLHLSERNRKLVAVAQDLLWQKGFSADVERHGFWTYEPFLTELASRKHVADWRNLFFLLPWEMGDFMASTKPEAEELIARRDYSCLSVRNDAVEMLTGEAAHRFVDLLGVSKMDPVV